MCLLERCRRKTAPHSQSDRGCVLMYSATRPISTSRHMWTMHKSTYLYIITKSFFSLLPHQPVHIHTQSLDTSPRYIMRVFLLPISTRRTLIYCDRVATKVNASGTQSYHDRIVNKANDTWASWESSSNKYKKKLTDYGNLIFNRISYEEWGLKTLPSSTADLTPTEIVFPGQFLDQKRVPEILKRLATERQGLHKKRFWGSLIGLPFTIPVGLLPVIPNIPGLYLGFRAWSHFKGLLCLQLMIKFVQRARRC
jgi:hypothetical protein